jgi:hydroxypyruvate isomerase
MTTFLPKPATPAPTSHRDAGWDLSVHADEIYPAASGLEPGLALLARFGIGHTNLRVVNGADSILRLSNSELDSLAAMLKCHGIAVHALDTPLFKCPLRSNQGINWGYSPGFSPDLTFTDHLWYLDRSIEIAERLGAEQIRCSAFWREYDLDAALGEVTDKLGQAANRAGAAGRRLFLQNQPDTLAGTGVELARILNAVNSPSLTAAYDLANSGRRAGVPYPDDYRALDQHLGAVQVRFQTIDLRSGCVSPQKSDFSGPKLSYKPAFFWLQPEVPVSGWVKIGAQRFELDGARTYLAIEETVGIDHRSFFQALKQGGYHGTISVDSNFRQHTLEAARVRDPEIDFAKTISSLRQLIGEVWS